MGGQLDFVKEILRLRREFVAELNQDGFSPLHISSANGDIEIVKELLEVDKSVCTLKGREGKMPLHYAAIKGRVAVIRELLSACADSIEDATARGETALHLAVNNNQFEAFKVFVEHLMQHKKEGVLRNEDQRGNTVLHIAVSRKQYKVIDFLLNQRNVPRGVMEMNSMNKRGLTALDVLLCFESEEGDREIGEILLQAGAMGARDLNSSALAPATAIATATATTNSQYLPTTSEISRITYVNYFKYDKIRDKPGDVRNCLLVIATLIVTATYQAVLSPPGGAWQDQSSGCSDNSTRTNTTSTAATAEPHTAGKRIMQTRNSVLYGFFLFFNTMGFSTSLYMIQVLTSGFPLQLELYASMGAIMLTYDLSVAAFTPKSAVSIFFVVMSIIYIYAVSWILALYRYFLEKVQKRLGITIVNEPGV